MWVGVKANGGLCVWRVEVRRGRKERLGLAGLGQTANSTFNQHRTTVVACPQPESLRNRHWYIGGSSASLRPIKGHAPLRLVTEKESIAPPALVDHHES